MGTRQKEVLVAESERSASHGWMKQIQLTIHPFSALIGAALVCLTMLTVGAIAVQGSSSTRDVSAIEDVNSPRAANAVAVYEGVAYTVPSGKSLVVTGIGLISGANGDVYVKFDSVSVLCAEPGSMYHSLVPVPFGLVAKSGQIVKAYTPPSSDWGVILGYLVDA